MTHTHHLLGLPEGAKLFRRQQVQMGGEGLFKIFSRQCSRLKVLAYATMRSEECIWLMCGHRAQKCHYLLCKLSTLKGLSQDLKTGTKGLNL